MGFSEPCDTKIQRQGLCPRGSPRGKLSSHTEGRRGTRPSERGRGSQVTGGAHPPPEAARRQGGERFLRCALLEKGRAGGPSGRSGARPGSGAGEQPPLFLFRLLAGRHLGNVCLQLRAHERKRGDVRQEKLGGLPHGGGPWMAAGGGVSTFCSGCREHGRFLTEGRGVGGKSRFISTTCPSPRRGAF